MEQQLNNVAKMESKLDVKKMSELEVNREYKVTALQKIHNEYNGVMATLNDEFNVFLPSRIAKFMKNNDYFTKIEKAAIDGCLDLLFLGGKYNKYKKNDYNIKLINTKTKRLSKNCKLLKDLTKDVYYAVTKIQSYCGKKSGARLSVEINNKYTVFLPKNDAEYYFYNKKKFLELEDGIKRRVLTLQCIGENNQVVLLENWPKPIHTIFNK
ncbi:uncharacterized protein LOC122853838 [Aphidius gifuensis]|uniref:uncharacterized protein LOC122850907 n=1 Tax=Aphidius gifuensis TaxID=684658 RepID=UPI001CDD8CAE|nr:uncharacterized protein LOC122850907 [Aphidius gifuensis]XP_044010189.1 uncharacterized protein LOC122853838 [Aphidius gifuensis]